MGWVDRHSSCYTIRDCVLNRASPNDNDRVRWIQPSCIDVIQQSNGQTPMIYIQRDITEYLAE